MTTPRGMYWRNTKTGGGDYSLDGIDGADLADLYFTMVVEATTLTPYVLDADSAAAESDPDVISPDTNAGDKRWILLGMRLAAVVADSITVDNTGLHILDTNASHDLILKPGSDLSADRTLTLTTGDADRTITLSGNPTLDDWFDQAVKIASSPTHAALTLTTDLTINNASTASNLRLGTFLSALDGDTEYNYITIGKANTTGDALVVGYRYDTTAADKAGFMSVYGDAVGTGLLLIKGGSVDVGAHNASTIGLKLGGTLITASAAELNYVDGVTSAIQTQLDARCLESVFGTSISTGLLLDGTALKTSAVLQKYHAIDPSANVQSLLGAANYAAIMALLSGQATAAFALNSQNLTGVGTIGCGTITSTGNLVIANAGNIGSASDTDAITISAAGNLDFTAQSGFSARLSVDQDVTQETYTTLAFDTETGDLQNEFNTSTYSFTAAQAGIYLVTLNTYMNEAIADGDSLISRIMKNAAFYAFDVRRMPATVKGCGSISTIMSLAANDVIHMEVWHDFTEARKMENASCVFSIGKIA